MIENLNKSSTIVDDKKEIIIIVEPSTAPIKAAGGAAPNIPYVNILIIYAFSMLHSMNSINERKKDCYLRIQLDGLVSEKIEKDRTARVAKAIKQDPHENSTTNAQGYSLYGGMAIGCIAGLSA